MLQDPQKIIVNILTSLEYKENPYICASRLIAAVQQKTLEKLLETLVTDRRKEIIIRLEAQKSDQEKQVVLYEYFAKNDVDDIFANSFQGIFSDFIQDAITHAKEEQKIQLDAYLQSAMNE